MSKIVKYVGLDVHKDSITIIKMPHPAQQIALTKYLDAVENHEAHVKRFDKVITASCQTWRLLPVIEALQALMGISLLSAVTVIAERRILPKKEN